MIKTIYISAATDKMNKAQAEAWLVYWAKFYKIDVALVRAFKKHESINGTSRERFEPHLMSKTNRNTKWYRDILTKKECDDPYSFYSLGDMHILFGIAKTMGFRGTPQKLFHPKYNYQYAVKYIKFLCDKEGDLERVISAYNQGQVSYKRKGKRKIFKSKYIDKNKNGLKDRYEKWKNQWYVNRIVKYYYAFGGKIKMPKYKKYYRRST